MNLEEALYLAFKELKIKIPSNTKKIILDDVILALCIDETKFAQLLGYSASGDGGFKYFRKRLLPDKPIKLKSYTKYILSLIQLQQCINCKKIKSIDSYYIDNNNPYYKLSSICKICDLSRNRDLNRQRKTSKNHYYLNRAKYIERNARRRNKETLATPLWTDKLKIKQFYKNCPKGYHVDHIIPLKGKLVCGLHVLNNLQYLLAEDNLKKSNTYSIDS